MRGARVLAAVAALAVALVGEQAVRPDAGYRAAAASSLPTAMSVSAASQAAQHLLEALAGGPVSVVRDVRGIARSVGAPAGHVLALPRGAAGGSPEAMARAQLDRAAALFGLVDPVAELAVEPRPAGLPTGPGDDLIVRFQQLRGGLAVIGGDLSVVMDPKGGLRSITGAISPEVVAAQPVAVTAETARATAIALVAREHPSARLSRLHVAALNRAFLDPKLVGLPSRLGLRPASVWWAEVGDGGLIREAVLIDSATGAVPFHWSMLTNALNRVICDEANAPDSNSDGANCDGSKGHPYVLSETSKPVTGIDDRSQAFNRAGVTADFYNKFLKVDLTSLIGSNNGDGQKLRSTVNFCPSDGTCIAGLLSNAFWNGNGMFYGSAWPDAQDIVSHELTHGVTEKTSHLLYFYQSGAINESMSDILGEIAQRSSEANFVEDNWEIGEESPLRALRSMKDPTLSLQQDGFGQPDEMTSELYYADSGFAINSCNAGCDNGGVHQNSGVGNKAGYLIAAGDSFNGASITGIGLAKAAMLYFRVENMLPSGAQYLDLGNTLNTACTGLVGQQAADGTVFTSDDCTQVRNAVTATAMAQQPSDPNVATPQANYCPGTRKFVNILSDEFESFSPVRWKLGSNLIWNLIGDYASKGKYSIYAAEPTSAISGSYTNSMILTHRIPVPKTNQTYLRFSHQYRLNAGFTGPYYDGVLLEYRIGTGAWKSLSSAHWQQGPSRKITPKGQSSFQGWGGNSAGFTSSKVDISFLHGKTVEFRWRMVWDGRGAVDGWTIDNVRFFNCTL